MYSRRHFVCSLLFFSPIILRRLYAFSGDVDVYKDPTCGCCNGWIAHLREHGFRVNVTEVDNSALQLIKTEHRIPAALRSCHTAVVDSYVVEGHVPAEDIERLLKDRPKALGLAVPGMPAGSPGMEAAQREKYAVLLFDQDGQSSVFREY